MFLNFKVMNTSTELIRSIIDLRSFEMKYRQALLFTLIEGLAQGESFQFIDSRSPREVEEEMAEARLSNYAWGRYGLSDEGDVTFFVRRTG